MEKAPGNREAEFSGSSDGRNSSPYQRIVIACPDNHIIVVKRFTSGGENLILLSIRDLITRRRTQRFVFVLFFLQKSKLKEEDLLPLKTRKDASKR